MWIGGARAVILDADKKVLMVKQQQEGRSIWLVPGGGIEAGENAMQAAIREVKEETGLDVDIKALLWHVEEVSEKRGQRFVNFFLAELKGGTLELGTDPERAEGEQVLSEVRFMSREEISELEVIYPEYLRDELWHFLSSRTEGYDAFKLRKNQIK